jgi:prepilin-type N-terminal cleavage/methylation domain-containing protein
MLASRFKKTDCRVSGNCGFSIIELLIVTAVSTVLAMVALPQYLRFAARARQSEAKANLSRIFLLEESFYAAHNTFHGHLPLIGFELLHRGTVGDPTKVTWATSKSKDSYAYIAVSSCGDIGDGDYPVKPSSLNLLVPSVEFWGEYMASPRACAPASNFCGQIYENFSVSRNAFTIEAMGCARGNMAPTYDPPNTPPIWDGCWYEEDFDRWTINENRQIRMFKPSHPGCP